MEAKINFENTEFAGTADFFFSQWERWIFAEELSGCHARGKIYADWNGEKYVIDYENKKLVAI